MANPTQVRTSPPKLNAFPSCLFMSCHVMNFIKQSYHILIYNITNSHRNNPIDMSVLNTLQPSLILQMIKHSKEAGETSTLGSLNPLSAETVTNTSTLLLFLHAHPEAELEVLGRLCRDTPEAVQANIDISMLGQYLQLCQGNRIQIRKYAAHLSPSHLHVLMHHLIGGGIAMDSILNYLLNYQVKAYIKDPSHHLAFHTFKLFLETSTPSQLSLLTTAYLNQYLDCLADPSFRDNLARQDIFNHLKLLELMHVANPDLKIGGLGQQELFVGVLLRGMRDFQTNGASALVANIFGGMLKEMGNYDAYIQSFFDVYLILDCYGTHLVKDVWDNFYKLTRGATEAGLKYLIPVEKLLHCLLEKVEEHTNQNVTKYCIQSLLTASAPATATLFHCLPNTVYGSLIQILNNGSHYHDCVFFHQDSKMYPVIQQFYIQAFTHFTDLDQLNTHVNLLVCSMHKFITFEHCLMAYSGILSQLPPIPGLLSGQSLAKLGDLIRRLYTRLTIRKRHILIKQLLTGIKNTLGNQQEVSIQQFMADFGLVLPIDATRQYQVGSSLPYLYQLILDRYGSQAIRNRIHQLKQASGQFKQGSDLLKQRDGSEQTLMLEAVLVSECPKYWQECLVKEVFDRELNYLAVASYTPQREYKLALDKLALAISYGMEPNLVAYLSANSASVDNLLTTIAQSIPNRPMHTSMTSCLQAICKSTQVCSSDNPSCKHFTKFIEFCIVKCLDCTAKCLDCTAKCLNCDYLHILISAVKFKLENTSQYRSLEQCLYNLFAAVTSGKLPCPSPKDSLRLEILLICILSNDRQFLKNLLTQQPRYHSEIPDICEIYDYEHYEELFLFIKLISVNYRQLCLAESIDHQWETYSLKLCQSVKECMSSMLHNLDYGVKEKQIVASAECVLKLAQLRGYDEAAVDLLEFVVKIGERYWGFQREIIFGVLNHFKIEGKRVPILPANISRLILGMIDIEEYRGHDSAITLHRHQTQKIYTHKLVDEGADNDGTALRLAAINWAAQILALLTDSEEGEQIKKWVEVFEACLQICMREPVKEKMFLTGSHKVKIKVWQFLMAFPQFLIRHHPDVSGLVFRCFESMSHNNLSEIRYYSELFMLKLIKHQQSEQLLHHFGSQLVDKLLVISGQTNLNKNIAYMVLAGITLDAKFSEQLYSALFVSVCSHIAYYRGLSQFFCFGLIQQARATRIQDLNFVESLYLEYQRDEDAIKLSSLLAEILEEYKLQIVKWNIWDNFLLKKPTLNGQIVHEDYYIEKFKNIRQKLNKFEGEYLPGKEVWKTLLRSETAQTGVRQHGDDNRQTTSFQRKIDPSLDDIYSFKRGCTDVLADTRIMVVSAQKIALYGHLARVSEIMGVKELCIPNRNIIGMQDFYNVSVTAENWLNITEHEFQVKQVAKPNPKKASKKSTNSKDKLKKQEQIGQQQFSSCETVHKVLRNLLMQDFKIYRVKKSSKESSLPHAFQPAQKSVLIIDQLNLLEEELAPYVQSRQISFGLMYSSHVEATIFIWETFKKYMS